MPIRVSAIVSLYRGERFIRGALDDLVGQTLHGRGELEIVIIDSGSPENEAPIIREFQARTPHIVYLRTERETIYAAWNRAVGLATGRYLTNANVDDRHRPDALERMADVLDRSSAGVAYADAYITRVENETFERHQADRVFHWPAYSMRQLLMQSMFGPQPMWRRALHDQIGLFDPRYTIAGDYEFFIRAARQQGAEHIDEVLGLYWEGGTESANLQRCQDETRAILRLYREEIAIEDVYPSCAELGAEGRAAACWDFARCIANGPHPDAALTRKLRAKALTSLVSAGPRAVLNLRRVREQVLAGVPPLATSIVRARRAE